jgi:hypothetical protein
VVARNIIGRMEFANDKFFNTWEEALNYIRHFESSTHSRFIVTKKKKDGMQHRGMLELE